MLKILESFRRRADAMAAVEFALIAPLMITLFFGTIEVCNALSCHQKVTTVASTAADLVAQATQVSDSQMEDIFSAAGSIMVPYPNADITITVSSIGGDDKVLWSDKWDGSNLQRGHSVGSTIAIPQGLFPTDCTKPDDCSVILAEVTYQFQSPYGQFLLGALPMTDTFYAKPRRSVTVVHT